MAPDYNMETDWSLSCPLQPYTHNKNRLSRLYLYMYVIIKKAISLQGARKDLKGGKGSFIKKTIRTAEW